MILINGEETAAPKWLYNGAMANVTIKDLPAQLHDRLKENAKMNRRSLNAEVITLLETAMEPRRVNVDEVLAAARAVRSQVKRELSDQDINRMKRQGRL
jgi:plasmid stability protein